MGDSFSVAELNAEMGKAFGYLEELHAIDAILDGIDQRGMEDLYYGGSSSTGGSYGANTKIDLGVTYPFDKMIRVVNVGTEGGGYPFSSPPTETRTPIDLSFIDDAYTDATSWREGVQADYESLTEQIVAVPAGRFRAMSYAIVDQYVRLSTTIGDNWDQLQTRDGEFEGDTADNYFQFFSAPVTKIRDNQCFALDHVNTMISALKAVNDCGQHSLMNLATMTTDVARKQLEKRQADSREMSTSEALKILSLGTGIVAAFTFPAPLVSASLGATSAMLGYAADQVPDGPGAETTIEGASATAVTDTLGDKIRELRHQLSEGYFSVADKATELQSDIGEMEEPWDATTGANYWIPIRSGLHRGDPEFYHETSGQGR